MTEATTEYKTESQVIEPVDELTELNLKVAAIAGWTEIEEWHRSLNSHPDLKVNKKVYIGKNDRKELGIFIPDYTSNLSAIYAVITEFMAVVESNLKLEFSPSQFYTGSPDPLSFVTAHGATFYDKSPAIALCKLLLEIAPSLPKPSPEKPLNSYDLKVIGDYVSTLKFESEVKATDDEVEPTVIEATFI